ncbi:MAG: RluA family pseudouridine synthase [Candidatus Brocadiia bacterium]|jgi:RluA family pseudouridine synthase
MMDNPEENIVLVVPARCAGQNLRVFLGDALPLEPEEFVRHLIVSGNVAVNGETSDPKRVLRAGENVTVAGRAAARRKFQTEVIRAPVLYEDEQVVVLNKPAGCTVVRERHSEACPFQNGVLEHVRRSPTYAAIAQRESYRPRAVHRLDRDTTGAVIFVKSREAELHLSRQFRERTIKKEYLAILHGEMLTETGSVEVPLAAHEHELERVFVDERHGKSAVTPYEVVERFRGFTLVRALPQTGRRHQVRIHFSHIGYPIAADRVYGGGSTVLLSAFKRGYRAKRGQEETPLLARPALHASALTFLPVAAATSIRVEAPLARDFQVLLKMLRKYATGGARPEQWESEE